MRTRTLTGLAAAALCLALVCTAQAQINAIAAPFLRVEKKPGPKAAPLVTGPTSVPYDRLMEIMVELAWLADPVTSQCQLEAKVKGTTLYVHGKLADAAARDAVLRIARLNCPMKVVDESKIAGNRSEKVAPADSALLLQAAAVALREAFPTYHQNFRLQTSGEGKITVNGPVQGFEEKLAVSKALRRVRGCGCVLNQLALPGHSSHGIAPVAVSAPPRIDVPNAIPAKAIAQPGANAPPLVRIRPRSRSRFRALLSLPDSGSQARAQLAVNLNSNVILTKVAPEPAATSSIQRVAHSEPARPDMPPPRRSSPMLEFKPASGLDPTPTGQPYETRGIVVVPDGDPVAISAHQLKERIMGLAGQGGKSAYVCFTSPKEVQIQIRARSLAEAAQTAHVIMQIPELGAYHVDMRFQLIRETNRR